MIFRINLLNPSRLATSISLVALTVGLAACGGGQGGSDNTATNNNAPNATPGKLDLAQNVSLTGAGASFPSPMYQRWFSDFNKKYPKAQINYQSVGSGAGVEQFTAGTVDFGASDVAMKDEEMPR